VELLSKNSNACHHNPPTSQVDGRRTHGRTDRQTDRHTTCHDNTALRYASRGKISHNFATGLPINVMSGMWGFRLDLHFYHRGHTRTAVARKPCTNWAFLFNFYMSIIYGYISAAGTGRMGLHSNFTDGLQKAGA